MPCWCRVVYLVETFLCFCTFTICSSFHSFLYLTFFHISDTISSFKTRSTFLQSHKLCQINKISQVTKNVKRLLNLLQGWRAIQIYLDLSTFLINHTLSQNAVAWGVVHKWYHNFFQQFDSSPTLPLFYKMFDSSSLNTVGF